ncbi:MAG: hypothetical protein IJR97_00005, partial [Clostridia bacterium]|nr:hypothetical protein [Clostridia bacterium]
ARFRPPVSATGGGRLRAPPIPPLLNGGYVVCACCLRRALAAKWMRRRPRTGLCNSRFLYFYNPAVLYLLFPPSFVLSGLLSNHMIPFLIILGLLLVQQPHVY